MSSFWADACSHEENKSLQDRIYASHVSCGTTVYLLPLPLPPRNRFCCRNARSSWLTRFREQIAAYCVSAVVSGTMFYRWLRIGEAGRKLVWSLYGWFSGLMLCGSCVGAVTWAAWMQVIINEFIGVRDPNLSGSQRFFYWSLSDRWNSGFKVMYATEFLCLSMAKLLVLDRMSDFAAGGSISRRLVVGKRVLMASVTAGNLAGLAGNIAASVRYGRRADLLMALSADLAANNTAAADPKFAQVSDQLQLALQISSVQSFCEVAVLLLIVLAFAVVGFACARHVSSALSVLDALGPEMAAGMHMRQNVVDSAMALGKQMRHKVIVTTAVVFVAFLICSVYSTLYAVALQLQEFSNMSRACSGKSVCDASCFNVYTHIYFWIFRTPEFQLTIVLLSKPLPLLVVLWYMTTGQMRHGMQQNQIEMAKMKGKLLNKLAFWRRDPL